MLVEYRIARVEPPGLFGRVLHVTLVTPQAVGWVAWTMLLLLLMKRLTLLAA